MASTTSLLLLPLHGKHTRKSEERKATEETREEIFSIDDSLSPRNRMDIESQDFVVKLFPSSCLLVQSQEKQRKKRNDRKESK